MKTLKWMTGMVLGTGLLLVSCTSTDEELNIDTTIALGRLLLQNGQMQVFCNFEDC